MISSYFVIHNVAMLYGDSIIVPGPVEDYLISIACSLDVVVPRELNRTISRRSYHKLPVLGRLLPSTSLRPDFSARYMSLVRTYLTVEQSLRAHAYRALSVLRPAPNPRPQAFDRTFKSYSTLAPRRPSGSTSLCPGSAP